ncbi:hypothetical protein J6590_099406 [Homalodisca vitripennis]|nr:hypothetical protein J6590_099406 [Homalodisca vitripennis]
MNLYPLIDSTNKQAELECRLLNVSRYHQHSNSVCLAYEEALIWHLESQLEDPEISLRIEHRGAPECPQHVALPGKIQILFHIYRYNHYLLDGVDGRTVYSVGLTQVSFSVIFSAVLSLHEEVKGKGVPSAAFALWFKTMFANFNAE